MCHFTYGAILLFPLISLESHVSVVFAPLLLSQVFLRERDKGLFPLPMKVKLTGQNSHHRLIEEFL